MTMPSMVHYERLAALFDYPGPDYPAHVARARAVVAERYPAAATALGEFAALLPTDGPVFVPTALDEVQEIFTRSFDVQSVTTLGVGYVMFGDDYKRGELLVNLGRECREAGVDCGTELPDHLPNVLRLLAVWNDHETRQELVEEVLRPAVRQMIGEFGPNRMEARNRLYRKHFKTLIASSEQRGTLFRGPLCALAAVLDGDFPPQERAATVLKSDFLRSVSQELDIEAGTAEPDQDLVQLRGRS